MFASYLWNLQSLNGEGLAPNNNRCFLLDPNNAVLVGEYIAKFVAGGLAHYSVIIEHDLQKINFEKHTKPQNHQDAIRKYLLAAVSAAAGSTSTTVAPGTSPNQVAFKDIWKGIKKGDPLNGQKNILMVFCLAEAMKSIDQKCFARVAEIGFFRDERKGRDTVQGGDRGIGDGVEMSGQERDIGTDFSELDSAWVALQRLTTPAKLIFYFDSNKNCQKFIKTENKPLKLFLII